MKRELEKMEADFVPDGEKFTSLQQEIAVKTKKLEKVRIKDLQSILTFPSSGISCSIPKQILEIFRKSGRQKKRSF